MKLYDLINSNNWLSVELTLRRLYPDQENMLDNYQTVFGKLKITPPVTYDMQIVLTEYNCDPAFESEKKTYIDVSGQKLIPEPDSLADIYAIEFVEWKNWLGMEIAASTLNQFSDLEIIAHCLVEMTYAGFEEEEIQNQLQAFETTAEEYNHLTDEEKKKQTITLDELLKQLKIGKDKN